MTMKMCGLRVGFGVSESNLTDVRTSPELPLIWGWLVGLRTSGPVWTIFVIRVVGLKSSTVTDICGCIGDPRWRYPKL